MGRRPGIQAQKRKADELEATERANVKNLVRRFAARKLAADAESDFGERRRDVGRGAVEDGGNANGNGVGVAGGVSERRRKGSPQSAPPPRCWGREAEIARNKEEERRKRMRTSPAAVLLMVVSTIAVFVPNQPALMSSASSVSGRV